MDVNNIAQEYAEFVKTARIETDTDIKYLPLEKHETRHDRFSRHLVGMISMFNAKYGTPEMSAYVTAWKELNAYFSGSENIEALKQMQILEFKNRIGESAEYLKPYKDHTLPAKS